MNLALQLYGFAVT